MFKPTSFILLLSLSCSFTYVPYRFLAGPGHDIPNSFKTQTTLSVEDFTTIDMGGDVEISLFSEAISPLEDFRLGIIKPADVIYSQCETALSLPDPCGQSTAELEALVMPICKPESFIHQQDLTKKYDPKQLDTLKGSLQVLLSPLRDQDIPSSLLSPDLINKGRMILAKMDIAALRTNYQAATHLIKNQQRSCPSARLSAIKSEIDRILDQVESSAAFSVLENQKKKAELQANNRCRSVLPYPELTDEDRIYLSTYVGGLSWRVRGGALWETDGTQSRRKHFANKVFSNLIVLNSSDRKLGDKYGEAAVQRLQIKGWSEWFDMGRTDHDDVSDMRGMTVRGLYQIGVGSYYGPIAGASPKEPFEKRGYDSSLIRIAGTQMGPCYMYASRFLEHHPIASDLTSPLMHFMHGSHSEWGEACFGAVLGHAISRTLLDGRVCD